MDAHKTFYCCFDADERKANDNVSPSVLPIQLTNSTGTQLEHLNEDCLLEIFSSNSLTPMDLCSLAETCTRFKEITQRVFPKSYRIVYEFYGNERYKFQLKSGKLLSTDLHDVGRILRSFASNLSKLSMGSGDQELVSLFGKHCSDVSLDHLELSHWKSIEAVKMNVNSILQRLRKLTVYECHFLKDVTFQNSNFASLIELEICHSRECVAILKQTFPNLKRFIWYFSHVYTRDDNDASHILYTFIRRHGQLKTIGIHGTSVYRSAILHVIGSSCKDLQELTLRYNSRREININFYTQGGLSNLKKLNLELYNLNTHHIALLQAAKSLETLKIICDKREPIQMAEVLLQFQNLREFYWSGYYFNRISWAMLTQLRKVYLKFDKAYEGFGVVELLNIMSELINLEELSIASKFNLTKEDFSRIIKIVERREFVLTLKCYCDFKLEKNCNVKQKVKLIKKNWWDDLDED